MAIALCIAWVIHAFAFTVYTVTDNALTPEILRGNRIIVDKLSPFTPQKGDLLVYNDSTHSYIGKVVNLPGDTIKLANDLYQIPKKCCNHCHCPQCQPYFLKTSKGLQLVYKHQMEGKAYLLF